MDTLQIAQNAAKLGAQYAQKYFNTNLEVELKEDLTPVTIADKETEKVIKEYISQQIPDAKFVGEEFGGDYNQDCYWLIDPIDGTAYLPEESLFGVHSLRIWNMEKLWSGSLISLIPVNSSMPKRVKGHSLMGNLSMYHREKLSKRH